MDIRKTKTINEIKSGYSSIKLVVDASRKLAENIKDKITAQPRFTDETFDETVKRLGLTDSDLAANKMQHIIKLVVTVLMVVLCLNSAFFAIIHGRLLFALAPAVLTVYFSMLSVVHAHRAYQIKNRRYCTTKQFLQEMTNKKVSN